LVFSFLPGFFSSPTVRNLQPILKKLALAQESAFGVAFVANTFPGVKTPKPPCPNAKWAKANNLC